MQGASLVSVQSVLFLKDRDNELSESDATRGKRLFKLQNYNRPWHVLNFKNWTLIKANFYQY